MTAIRKPSTAAPRTLAAALELLRVEGERADLLEQQRDKLADLMREQRAMDYRVAAALTAIYGTPKPARRGRKP